MGVERWVPWQYSPTARQVVSDLKTAGTPIVAVEITEVSVSPRDASYRFPLALVVGDEMKGIGAGVLDLADTAVGVPMAGMGNSINVTTAVAIVLYAAVEALATTNPRSAPSTLRRRQAQGLSLRALAHRAGVHYTTLAAIESGRRA